MEPIPVPTESLLPPDKSSGLRYVTYRTKDAPPAPNAVNKEERLWCFEPIGFVYDDTDAFLREISEWFCFDETDDLQQMEVIFYSRLQGNDIYWRQWSTQRQSQQIRLLLDQLDLAVDTRRMDVYRCLGYIALGAFGECNTEEEVSTAMINNAVLLFRNGALPALVEALHRELGRFPEHIEVASNVLSSPAVANLVIRPVDTLPLRLVMTPLYAMLEALRFSQDDKLQSFLRAELNDSFPHNDELLAVTLFDMLTRFCNGDAPHYPIRKVVLLLWKTLLSSLGGSREAYNVKNQQRKAYSLPVIEEFTPDVCRMMRPCSPPPPDSLASGAFVNQLNSISSNASSGSADVPSANSDAADLKPAIATQQQNQTQRTNATTSSLSSRSVSTKSSRPPHLWRPKVGSSDLEKFINERRWKFVRFTAPGDVESLIGLPKPIHEAVRVLKQHLYCSLAEAQLKEEEQISRSPITYQVVQVDDLPGDRLFGAMLPSLPQYCIAILKLTLAAEPPPPSNANAQNVGTSASGNSRTTAGTLSVLTDCVQLALTGQTAASVAASLRSGIETSRHRETILKGLSAILLLLLKHFKACHVLHFELICQHLVFANALPLLVRLLSHNLCGLAAAANSMAAAEFPANVLYAENRVMRGRSPVPAEQPSSIEQPYNWRVVHTAINLLRILNKLVKGKQHRIALLHSLRCAGLLKRTIRLKQPLAQLYALKLLKLQSRFLGRQWRRQNMHAVSAIYERVRHRLTDDWAYGALDSNNVNVRDGNDSIASSKSSANSNGGGNTPNPSGNAPAVGPACPEFQAAESQLRSMIDKFHTRKYHSYSPQAETSCAIDSVSAGGKMDAACSLLMPSLNSKSQQQSSGLPENRHCCTEDLKCHCAVWSASAPVNISSDLSAVCGDFFNSVLSSQITPEEWIQREVFDNPIDWDRLLQETC